MRVGLVGPYPLDPQRVRGGVESAFTTLVTGLTRLPDTEPHVLTFVPGLDAPRRQEVGGVPVHHLPGTRRLSSSTFHLRETRELRRALASLAPDVVHGQETLRYGFVCLRNERLAPVVLSIHGIVREEVPYASGIDRLRLGLAGRLLERYCIGHGKYFVQPTPYPEQLFGDELRGRIVDVSNPVGDRFFSARPEPVVGRMLYAGSVIPRKRLLDLVEALPALAAAVSEAHLHVAGETAGSEYGARVRARVEELGLQDVVRFLGALSPEEMLEEYRRASALVLPSGQETSPIVIGEAMAVGVPVVATDVGGVRYLVDDGRTGRLVGPGDVPGLARALQDVLGSSERGRELGDEARRRAERDFRAEIVAARVRSVYELALGGAGTP